ncbi:MAG: hypothetical protein E7270_01070 [Lachnospiraceae bacterium]|nr:hypothetical protein [Lachnospiraceae bacterium]
MGALEKIGSYAFDGCVNLTIDVLPSVEWVDSFAFRKCTSLQIPSFPQNLTQISMNAFHSTTGMGAVVFNCPLLEKIDTNCFQYSTLTVVGESLPDSVTEVGANAFAYCPNLVMNFNNGSGAAGLKTINNAAFGYDPQVNLANLPANVETIASNAFRATA